MRVNNPLLCITSLPVYILNIAAFKLHSNSFLSASPIAFKEREPQVQVLEKQPRELTIFSTKVFKKVNENLPKLDHINPSFSKQILLLGFPAFSTGPNTVITQQTL